MQLRFSAIEAESVTFRVGQVLPMPADLEVFAQECLAYGMPAGDHLEPGDVAEGTSTTGWPVRLVQGRVRNAAGEQHETRFVAIYRLFDWVGTITLTIATRAVFEARGEELLRSLMTADADLSDGRAIGLWDALGAEQATGPSQAPRGTPPRRRE